MLGVCACACACVCVPARPLANLVSKSNTSTCWRCMCYTREGVAGQPLLAPPILHVVEPRARGVTSREGLRSRGTKWVRACVRACVGWAVVVPQQTHERWGGLPAAG